jgi:hypothetical protein
MSVHSDDAPLSRVKRLIPTEVVYDQSYPVPPSDLPFASETAGHIDTVDQFIIATIKMRNNFFYPIKLVILPIFAIAILDFSLLLPI